MKKFVIIALISSLFACTSSKEKQAEEKKNEVLNRTTEDYTEHYPDGMIKVEGKLVNGERHGDWTYYYENGMIWSKGKFRNGIREGSAVIYYDNGKKKIEGEYEKGLKVGVWKVWEKDGSLAEKINLNEMLSAEDSLKLQLK